MQTAATTTARMVAITAIVHPVHNPGQHRKRVSPGAFSAVDHSQTAQRREPQVQRPSGGESLVMVHTLIVTTTA